MGPQTFLTDSIANVVLDTSVVINLTASGHAADLLGALPNQVLVVDTVPLELERGRHRGRRDADLFNELVSADLIEVVALGNPSLSTFESLVTGRAAETLDDGEAATIAYAAGHNAIGIIDERKAGRICRDKFPMLPLGCTVDLFTHSEALRVLGQTNLSEAVLNALRLARMRVPPHHVEWVVGLIGPERAAQCTSLPRAARERGQTN